MSTVLVVAPFFLHLFSTDPYTMSPFWFEFSIQSSVNVAAQPMDILFHIPSIINHKIEATSCTLP